MKLCTPIGLVVTIAAAVSGVYGDSLILAVVDNDFNGTIVKLCNAETARFGPTDDFYSLAGVFVNAVPVNGCHPLRPPPYRRNDSLAWIALMARDEGGSVGGCFFDRKIFNAQEAGFDAAVIYNYQDSISVMQASSLGDKIDIPSAMITYSCGSRIQEKYAYTPARDARYTAHFREVFPFDFNVYVISFVTIITACFVLFALLWVLRWLRDWRIRQRSRLSKSSLKKLKVKKFEKGTDPYECCAICLEDFEPGDKLRILPCNHAYHTKCIDPWLLKNRSICPVCKRRVFPRRPGEAADDEDEEEATAGASGSAAAAAAMPDGAGGSGSNEGAAATAGQDASVANGDGATVVVVTAATAAIPDAASNSRPQMDGERTPLLSSSSTSSVTSGGSFDRAVVAFDNPALRLTDEEPQQHSSSAAAVPAAAPAASVAKATDNPAAVAAVKEPARDSRSSSLRNGYHI